MPYSVKRYKVISPFRVPVEAGDHLKDTFGLLSVLIDPKMTVEVPQGAEIHDVIIEDGDLFVIVSANHDQPLEERTIFCAMEGHKIPDGVTCFGSVEYCVGYRCYFFT